MRELGALRLARRTRGVEDHRRVVGPALGDVGAVRSEQQRLELARLDEHALGARLLGAGARRRRGTVAQLERVVAFDAKDAADAANTFGFL